ncbi:hypothetical protein ETD86_19790 [Nonomuraea turkmeniaca]|uniref:Uncharacterized protein n=1 Tax=Nonomuraea turkmeniaca TaxID=103838 RepID=A0A5S4FHK1_9ACTN|nr:hypothetical protein [Nonomuraea turkmeniaca]TMR19413.1 hypothetical protein ETD86_19790 [Nonomuraea turkmeniaca]
MRHLSTITLPHLATAPPNPPAGITLLYAKAAGLHACTPAERDVPLALTWRRLPANVSAGTAGITITALNAPVTTGTYSVTYFGTYTGASASVGASFAVPGPAASAIIGHLEIATADGFDMKPLTGLGGYVGTGLSLGATALPFIIRATITFTTAGTLSLSANGHGGRRRCRLSQLGREHADADSADRAGGAVSQRLRRPRRPSGDRGRRRDRHPGHVDPAGCGVAHRWVGAQREIRHRVGAPRGQLKDAAHLQKLACQ